MVSIIVCQPTGDLNLAMLTSNNNIRDLWLSALMMGIALFWFFIGPLIVDMLSMAENLFVFVSGATTVIGLLGVVFFIRTILFFGEFFVNQDSIPLALYRSIIDQEGCGVFFKDRKGTYQYINTVAKQLLGLENKLVTRKTDVELMRAELAHKQKTEDKRIIENGETIRWAQAVNRGQGTEHYQCYKMPLKNPRGKIIGVLGVFVNVTEQKKEQAAKEEAEARYSTIFEQLPYPVMMLDVASMLPVSYNRAMNGLLGYTPEEFSRLRMNMYVADKDVEFVKILVPELCRKGPGDFELELVKKNKDLVEVSGFGQKLVLAGKNYLHVILQDVTEAKKISNDLIYSQLKYTALFERLIDAVFIVDINTLQVIRANESAIKLTGHSIEELSSLTILDFDAETGQTQMHEKIRRLELTSHITYEHVIRVQSGQHLEVEVHADKVNYGNAIVYQFLMRDISKRKKLERTLEQRNQQLIEVSDDLSEAVMIVGVDGDIQFLNRAFSEQLGYTAEVINRCIMGADNDLAQNSPWQKTVQNSLTETGRWQGLVQYYANDGQLDSRATSIHAMTNIDNKIVQYVVVITDHVDDQLVNANDNWVCRFLSENSAELNRG